LSTEENSKGSWRNRYRASKKDANRAKGANKRNCEIEDPFLGQNGFSIDLTTFGRSSGQLLPPILQPPPPTPEEHIENDETTRYPHTRALDNSRWHWNKEMVEEADEREGARTTSTPEEFRPP
jgi:hypothetical protein